MMKITKSQVEEFRAKHPEDYISRCREFAKFYGPDYAADLLPKLARTVLGTYEDLRLTVNRSSFGTSKEEQKVQHDLEAKALHAYQEARRALEIAIANRLAEDS